MLLPNDLPAPEETIFLNKKGELVILENGKATIVQPGQAFTASIFGEPTEFLHDPCCPDPTLLPARCRVCPQYFETRKKLTEYYGPSDCHLGIILNDHHWDTIPHPDEMDLKALGIPYCICQNEEYVRPSLPAALPRGVFLL